MPFVTHGGPQAVDLRLTDPVVFPQRCFSLCRLPGRSTQPVQNRGFCDPCGPRDAAHASPFGQQRQGFQDRFARCLASLEHRAVGFGKRSTAARTPLPLRAIPGVPKADDLRRRDFTVQLTCGAHPLIL